ncbi:hypothetical protein GPALN_004863 [Globodera pallida]|nr:hypothetical protein GPALN_004863 [Globodera pallida]
MNSSFEAGNQRSERICKDAKDYLEALELVQLKLFAHDLVATVNLMDDVYDDGFQHFEDRGSYHTVSPLTSETKSSGRRGQHQRPTTSRQAVAVDADIESLHQSINVDFLVAQACWPNYSAMRDPERGGWFIQAICRIFAAKAAQEDILKLMPRVHALLQHFVTKEGEKQVGDTRYSLTKTFYFNPLE